MAGAPGPTAGSACGDDMSRLRRAKEPFRFYTRLHLREVTGLRAATLEQLLQGVRAVPGSVIYHHTHHFLQQHQYLTPEPPNDFAYWVREILGDVELGERLASIDTLDFPTIRALRDLIADTIDRHLAQRPSARLRFADPGQEFHFIRAISFVLPTGDTAVDLGEFARTLERITIDSLYYHVFEARLRLEQPTNDFALWMHTALQESVLAEEISRLDPYSYTMENLRRTILDLIRRRLNRSAAP